MTRIRRSNGIAPQRGLTLVELMVAMAIGLIVSLAVFSTLRSFEGRKRTATSINDIDQAGNWALYSLDQWVRSAGTGFSQADGAAFGCTLTATLNGKQILPRTTALPAPFTSVNSGTTNVFKLIPLLILPGQTTPGVSGEASDVLLVMAGSSGGDETATMFSAVPTASQLNLISTLGFTANDLVLVADLSSAPTGTTCMVEQVASNFAFSSSAPTALSLYTSSSGYYDSTNLTGFTDTDYDAVFDLGNAADANPPRFAVIGVGDNDTLVGFDLLQDLNPTSDGTQVPFPIADSVFEMHARYGIDSDGDGNVDSWVAATGNYAPAKLTAGTAAALALLKTIRAVRIGLIMRTSLREKDVVSASSLTLFSDLDASYTRTLSTEERHYRYRMIETTIPLRNSLMLNTS